ncbi:MAG TPA: addiction module protein [Longimicrobiales bacterium]|nr:addiction module protein [Longimicrobiales bacterium]
MSKEHFYLQIPMTQASQSIESAALSLPPEERARLAERLLASLELDPEIETAWMTEVAERVDAWEAGGMEEIPWEEARARILSRLRSE